MNKVWRKIVAAIMLLAAAENPFAQAQRIDRSPVPEGTALVERDRMHAVYERYLAQWQAVHPEEATIWGLHARDNRLTMRDDNTYEKQKKVAQRFVLRLQKEVRKEKLQPADLYDYRIFLNKLEVDVHDFNRWDYRDQMPQAYIRMPTIFHMLHVDYAPYSKRTKTAISRLEQMPHILAQGRKLLKHPPRPWTEQAIEEVDGALEYLNDLSTLLEPSYSEDPLAEERVEDIIPRLRTALEDYKIFLKDVLLLRSTGDFAVGKETYEFYLAKKYFLRYKASKAYRLAKRHFRRIRRELKRTARRINRKKKWHELLEEVGSNHPQMNRILKTVHSEHRRARREFSRENIAALPKENVFIVPTPAFMKPTTSMASYLPPAPLDDSKTGHILVTLPGKYLADGEKKAILRRVFNYHDISCLVARWGWLGHHAQAAGAKRITSKIRKTFPSPIFVNGWGLYSQELAREIGFYKSELAHLAQTRSKLLCAAHAILDVQLHRGRMTFEQAVGFLEEKLGLPRSVARADVLWITQNPTLGASTLLGMLEIKRLRKRREYRLGDRFSMKEFHDRLLGYGPVPLSLIEDDLERE